MKCGGVTFHRDPVLHRALRRPILIYALLTFRLTVASVLPWNGVDWMHVETDQYHSKDSRWVQISAEMGVRYAIVNFAGPQIPTTSQHTHFKAYKDNAHCLAVTMFSSTGCVPAHKP